MENDLGTRRRYKWKSVEVDVFRRG